MAFKLVVGWSLLRALQQAVLAMGSLRGGDQKGWNQTTLRVFWVARDRLGKSNKDKVEQALGGTLGILLLRWSLSEAPRVTRRPLAELPGFCQLLSKPDAN